MKMTELNAYNSTAMISIECVPKEGAWAFAWIIIPISEVFINSLLIFVTYRSKQQLRHNYVYAYVISVFTGNLFLGVITVYSLLNYVFVFERYWGKPQPFIVDRASGGHESLQLWWSFRRAFMVSVYLINNANVSALIYGIRDSSYFVGRNPSADVKSTKKMATLRTRRSRAQVIITFVWLFPLCFTFFGLFFNCIDDCLCVYANYGPEVNYCQTDVNRECSRIWMPLTHRFLFAVALTWCVEIIFIVFMLVSAITRAKRAMKPQSSDGQFTIPDTPISVTETISISQMASPVALLSPPSRTSSTLTHSTTKFDFSGLHKVSYMNPKVKLLVAIAVTFFVTSLPLVVVIMIDVSSVDYVILRFSVTATLAISLLYGLIVPVILVYYMPSLKTATQKFFLSCKCCTKTTANVGTNRGNVVR